MGTSIFFEDLAVGDVERFGGYDVTREEVLAFASRYDPLDIHLDDAAAARNPYFGRLSASGLHTLAMTGRMVVDQGKATGFQPAAGMGMDGMRLFTPVYPGDRLSVETEILTARRSRSKPDVGVITKRISTLNQTGQTVATFVSTLLVTARAPEAPVPQS